MSQKITSKNLTYDNSLPPFLARLRGHQTAHSGPDPILAAHRRPNQKRSASEEAEDAPVVVDEAGNEISLEDGLLAGEDKREADGGNGDQQGAPGDGDEGGPGQGKEKEKVAGIGGSRKRKVGRVIGEEHSDSEQKTRADKDSEHEARIAKASADARRLLGPDDDAPSRPTNATKASDEKSGAGRKSQQDGPQQKTVKSAKRRAAKKIKLSFGDNDDGE